MTLSTDNKNITKIVRGILQSNGIDNLKAEIDIIAKKGGKLIVVEVKTRNSDYLAGPEITVTKKKQKSIIRAANFYIQENELDIETQFDIISIIWNSKEKTIEHMEDAFYPLL